jgi:hypothetical protein
MKNLCHLCQGLLNGEGGLNGSQERRSYMSIPYHKTLLELRKGAARCKLCNLVWEDIAEEELSAIGWRAGITCSISPRPVNMDPNSNNANKVMLYNISFFIYRQDHMVRREAQGLNKSRELNKSVVLQKLEGRNFNTLRFGKRNLIYSRVRPA